MPATFTRKRNKRKSKFTFILAGQRPQLLIVLALFGLSFVGVGAYYKFKQSRAATSIAPCSVVTQLPIVPGIGPACKELNGLLRVTLKNGLVLHTHGTDSLKEINGKKFIISFMGEAEAASIGADPVAPVCVSSSGYYNRLIYATPAGQPNRYSSMIGAAQDNINRANGLLHQEGAKFGLNVNYNFYCNPANVQLNTSSRNWADVVNDLVSQGYSDPHAKYWIFNDIGCGNESNGAGSIVSDDQPGPNNGNNTGPSYALNNGCTGEWGGIVTGHEAEHTLGAVQLSAPDSSGAYHCNDGHDLLCYSDGGSKSNYNDNVCGGTYMGNLDCNHDDYFNPYPAPGSYLATHWNIASGYNRFISGLPAPPRDTTPPSAPSSLAVTGKSKTNVTLSWTGSTDNLGVSGYKIYRNNQFLTSLADTSFGDSGLTQNSYYSYYVTAFDAAGNQSAPSNYVWAKTCYTYLVVLTSCN